MAETPNAPFLYHIRHLIGMDPAAGLTDSQLLERFLAHRDETAVEGLVRRYGPLVLGVCRRVLHNAQAAEDAFQATFLVLIRKAPALLCYQPLGGWLYKVAYRLALRARANEARRRQCEAQAARRRPPTEDRATSPSDLVVAVEEELHRLPERHRAPLVLCYLEGKTHEQAAQVLGCPPGSMSARLAQARERLRAGLGRRGFGMGSAGVAAALATAGAKAAVPLPLLADTVRAAVWFARAEAGSAGFVSTQAVALARGACHAMFVNKLKIAAAVLLAAAMLGTGTTLLLKAAPQADPPAQAVGLAPSEPPPDPAKAPGERLPHGVLARMGSTQLRHGDVAFFAAYMPNGKALVTAGKDQTVRLWDLATGKELRRFDWREVPTDNAPESVEDGILQQHEQRALEDMALSSQAALSSDGKLVAASRRGVVCLWETAGGKQLRQLQTGQKRLVQLAFSADGKSLLTLGPNGLVIAIWDVATGRCARRIQGKAPDGYRGEPFSPITEQNALVSPGWKYLAFQWRDPSGVRRIQVRDLATGKDLPSIHMGPFGGTLPLCFSADDKTLVWDQFPAGGVVFTDVATGKELRRLGDRRSDQGANVDETLAVAVSANGTSVALCTHSHTLELWDLASGKHTYPLGKPSRTELLRWFTDWAGTQARPALAFSPDGTQLACSLGGAAIRQFHVATGQEVSGSNHGPWAPVSTLALSADGKSLGTYGSGEAGRGWDWATGKETRPTGVPVGATHAVFADEGRFAFAMGNAVTLCGADGKQTWRIADDEWPPLAALALSPDGTVLATRSFDNPAVRLWDAKGKPRHTLGAAGEGPTGTGMGLAETGGVVTPELVFSPDGRRLAGAGPRRQLCLWDVASGTLLWEVPPQVGQAIERFAFSQSGHLLASVHTDRTVTLYEAASGARRARLGKADLKNRRVYLAYDYYGRSRLSSGTRRARPVCLAFSPDGRYLAVAQDTPAIRLWDVFAERELGQLRGHEGGVVSLLFAPDGRHLFSGGSDTTALTWDLSRLTGGTKGPSVLAKPVPAARLQPQALDALWNDLAGRDATRAFDALRRLSASPEQAVTLIRQHLLPVSPPGPERLGQLVADLESDRFALRRQAESELLELGAWAEPALRQALADNPPLDLRRRLEHLLERRFATTAGQIRDLRTVELLELIGNPEARQLLQALAGGEPSADSTREARNALRRLSKQAATP